MSYRPKVSIEGRTAAPVLKWAGGKRAVLPEILPRLPKEFKRYHEPMIGGAALLFELYNQRLRSSASISDMNADLINMYQQVKDNPDDLIKLLLKHERAHTKSSPWRDQEVAGATKQVKDPEGYYYRVRELDPSDPLERAARMIYLNRTGFNGLYRVNRQGKFNVPAGKYKNPAIVQAERVQACSQALQNVEITQQGFDKIKPKAGDFVYFDPPYDVWNQSSFIGYDSSAFGWEQQEHLAELAKRLASQGVKTMLSNHATDRIIDLYQQAGLHTHCFLVGRPISSKAATREPVYEVLATSYPPSEYRETVNNVARPL